MLPGFEGVVYSRSAVDLFVTSAVAGALAGWAVCAAPLRIGRSYSADAEPRFSCRQAAVRMAMAALGFAIGSGHNTPFFAGVAASTGTLWALMLGAIVVAGAALSGSVGLAVLVFVRLSPQVVCTR
ncbi:MAG: hypothetical protein KIT08_00515 [Anaerolineales bacterium]|nr:MAG: hypothetical protein KIT08_00515 [Anaerolineales bacterium]